MYCTKLSNNAYIRLESIGSNHHKTSLAKRYCLLRYIQMGAVVCLSILFNIPRYLDDHVVKRSDGSVKLARTDLGNDSIFQLIYAGLFYYIFIYALPVLILAGMTYRHLIFVFLPILSRLWHSAFDIYCDTAQYLPWTPTTVTGSVIYTNLIFALLSFFKRRVDET